MKKHNASKVALITVLVFFLLTWILHAASYSSEFVDQGRSQMGLSNLFYYLMVALQNFGDIAFFLILVGGFYGVLYKIPAYRNFLDAIVEKVNGKEKIVLSIFVVLIALAVSVGGAQIEIVLFLPFVISLILLMGYDKIVATFVVVGSIAAGLVGSTYGGNNLQSLTNYLSIAGDYQLGVRFAILLVGVMLVIFNILMYIKSHSTKVKIASKVEKEEEVKEEEVVVARPVEVPKKEVKKTTSKSSKKSTKKSSSKSRRSDNKAALKEEEVIVVKETVKEDKYVPAMVTKKHKTLPFIIIFALLFVLFVMAIIPWETLKINVFKDVTTSVSEFKLFGFPIFAKLLGIYNPFGSWTFRDFFLPIALVTALLVIIYNVKFSEAFDGFVEGMKEALVPVAVYVIVSTTFVIMYYHPIYLTVYKVVLDWTGTKFNIATTALVSLLSAIFHSDITFSFETLLPYYTGIIKETSHYEEVGIIVQSMYGLAALAVPTSLTLMATLAYLKVSYLEWLKKSWKLLVELFAVLMIVFIILSSI